LINHAHKYDDIDIYSNLYTQIEVVKSLTEIEVVANLKIELEMIKGFSTVIEGLWDAEP
jgi:hypothetical protein